MHHRVNIMSQRLLVALTAGLALGCASPRLTAQEVIEPQPVPSVAVSRMPAEVETPPISPAVSPGPLSLDQCLALGFQHQPAIDAARASLSAAHSGQTALNRMIIPRLFTPDYRVRQQQACHGVAIAEAGLSQAEWETRYSITRNFYTVQYIRAQEAVINDVLNNLDIGYKRAVKLYESGDPKVKISKVDLETIELQYGLVNAKKSQVVNGMQKALAALREAMGLGHDYPLEIANVGLPAAYEVVKVAGKDAKGKESEKNEYRQLFQLNKTELVASALANRPEVAQASTANRITDLEIQAQQRIRGWKGNTFASAADIHAKPIPQGIFNNEYRPGAIGLEMPPMLVGRMRDRSQRAADFNQRAIAVVEKTTNLVTLDVEAQYLKWQEAVEEIKELSEILPLAKALPDRVQKLNAQEFTGSALIQANTTSVLVRTQLNDALHMHALALVGLERATAGAFRMHPLPVPTK
jgi:outer membrane protein TolC